MKSEKTTPQLSHAFCFRKATGAGQDCESFFASFVASPVHLGGWPADMPAICDLARAHDIAVIEDCAQAHGACTNGQSVGSFGAVSAWSFCQDKIMTTAGEGGMVATSSPELWDKMWALKDHGKTHEAR